MKKIKNKVNLYIVVYTFVSLVSGLVLAVWPEETIIIICYLIGFSLVFFGGAKTIGYFMERDNVEFYKFVLLIGIACTGIGIFVILKPEVVVSIFPFVLSAIIILSSLLKLQNAVDLQRSGYDKWWIVLILAVVSNVLGIVIMFNTFEIGVTMTRFIGIALVVNSVMDAVSFFCIAQKMKAMQLVIEEQAD